MTFNTQVYADNLLANLSELTIYQQDVAAFSTSQSVEELLITVQKVMAFQLKQPHLATLSTQAVWPATHWAMMAFARILDTLGIDYTLHEAPNQRLATLQFPQWPNAEWQFVAAPLAAGGFYLMELTQNKRLFYWDLAQKRWYLNHDDLLALVQSEAIRRAGVVATRQVQQQFQQVGVALSEVGYQVDTRLLDTQEQGHLSLVTNDLTADVLDRLFILAAQENIVLKRVEHETISGAELYLADDVTIQIVHTRDASGQADWYYHLIGTEDTLATVVQTQSFFAQWYNEFKEQVAVHYHDEVFVDLKRL
jgi:hypothetical protein